MRIHNDRELRTTLERISRMQAQVARIREVEADPETYRSSASGFLAEVDRMNLEVRENRWTHPGELAASREG